MSLFKIFDIAGSGLVAQSQRLNVVASNLANADSTSGPNTSAYKAREVVFQSAQIAANAQLAIPSPAVQAGMGGVPAGYSAASDASALGVRVAGVVESNAAGKRVYDPSNSAADSEGYVTGSNVNVVEEMVNMLSASRSYQTNVEVMNTAKTLMMHTLQIES